MRLFTSRFIKDLLWIIIFCVAFYTLTNNPITHPQLQNIEGKYTIELMQYPLLLGIAGHNYLVLRNSQNNIVSELHGLATDVTTKKWKLIGIEQTDILQVWEFTHQDDFITKRTYPGVMLFSGGKEDVEKTWGKTNSCKDIINQKNIPYPPLGFTLQKDTLNSNSVAYTLVFCMGLSTRHIGLLTPGETKNLLNSP